jgi:hypothetical protein
VQQPAPVTACRRRRSGRHAAPDGIDGRASVAHAADRRRPARSSTSGSAAPLLSPPAGEAGLGWMTRTGPNGLRRGSMASWPKGSCSRTGRSGLGGRGWDE